MKIHKLIPLLLAAVCFTACAQIPPVKDIVPTEQQKTVAPPEDGWTAEKIMSVSYIGGNQLEYPLTLRSLGAGVSLTDIMWSGEDENERAYFLEDASDSSAVWIGTTYAEVEFGKEYSQITADDPMTKIMFYGEEFSVNGIKKNASADDVVKAFGDPDNITEVGKVRTIYAYSDRESGEEFMTVALDNDKKVLSINVDL
ncbi:MAG: hypothetical protein ACI4J0_00550 [Huintestinicola sp.]|uniref:hypothetical protein n=1 Tax=Huintestinicola sp. TaxID=2981661 RepID=UPI003F027FB2